MTRPASAPARRSADGEVVGGLLVIGGVAWLLDRSGAIDLPTETVLSVLLIALGVGMVVTARSRGGPGLVVLGVVLIALLASTSSIDVRFVRDAFGQQSIAPVTLAAAAPVTSLDVGHLDVDLRRLQEPSVTEGTAATRLRYHVEAGKVVVHLPPASELPVRIRAAAEFGKIELPGREEHGSDVSTTFIDEGFDTGAYGADLDLSVDFGSIRVVREAARG